MGNISVRAITFSHKNVPNTKHLQKLGTLVMDVKFV